jgi:protein involved in polysaccharide export with SLBB domain
MLSSKWRPFTYVALVLGLVAAGVFWAGCAQNKPLLPTDSMTLTTTNQPYFFVSGQVNFPGEHLMPGSEITLNDALAIAGGLTDFGNPHNVWIVNPGKATNIVDLTELQTDGKEVAIHSQNRIIVQKRFWWN